MVVAAIVAAAPANAQARPSLRDSVVAGMRVRVTAPTYLPERMSGKVVSPDSAGFRLDFVRADAATFVPWAGIQVLEVSEGAPRAGYALLGLLVGPAVGVAMGAVFCSRGTGNDPCFGPIGFGLTGLLVGPVLGAIVAPERWRRLP